ncbi:MAG TPA: protein kinase, partial [Kofleriaceae bacterium]
MADEVVIGPPQVAVVGEHAQPLPARYRVVGQIGAGGMGRVYRAHDTTLGRDVAIKLIETPDLHKPDHTSQRERFVREARAAARLHHPNSAVVHDVDPDAGWLVMELVEGRSLRVELEQGPLAPALVARI